jgi:hypothetical protein
LEVREKKKCLMLMAKRGIEVARPLYVLVLLIRSILVSERNAMRAIKVCPFISGECLWKIKRRASEPFHLCHVSYVSAERQRDTTQAQRVFLSVVKYNLGLPVSFCRRRAMPFCLPPVDLELGAAGGEGRPSGRWKATGSGGREEECGEEEYLRCAAAGVTWSS